MKEAISLFVLGITILIIIIIKCSIGKNDYFVPSLRNLLPIGNGSKPIGDSPIGQPMMYAKQYYPAKVPWYPETGRPCSGKCGITGVCVDGMCQMRDQVGTVFNVPV